MFGVLLSQFLNIHEIWKHLIGGGGTLYVLFSLFNQVQMAYRNNKTWAKKLAYLAKSLPYNILFLMGLVLFLSIIFTVLLLSVRSHN